jgi:hypothetical protein
VPRVGALRNRGEVERQHEAAPRLPDTGDYVLVRRGVPRALVMRCPDGCGETLTINLDPRSGKAWEVDQRNGRLTLYPSVWRKEGCRSHFIIWRDRLLWCDRGGYGVEVDEAIIAAAGAALREAAGRPVHYHVVAEMAAVHPWEALWACQVLQRRGQAATSDGDSFAAAKVAPPPRRGFWA